MRRMVIGSVTCFTLIVSTIGCLNNNRLPKMSVYESCQNKILGGIFPFYVSHKKWKEVF